MEDVKWFVRKWGALFLVLVLMVIAAGVYAGTKGTGKKCSVEEVWEPPVIISGNEEKKAETEDMVGTSSESALWFIPQAEECLISEKEKDEIKELALLAAEQVKDVYKDTIIENDIPYSSNIKNFTEEQCKRVVSLLGKAGFASVTENYNMENGKQVEEFYAHYLNKEDAMVTVFEVYRDGLIGVNTFVYRSGKIQTYYVGIGWMPKGIPELESEVVSDIAEIKLTEKGYFIYAHEIVIAHASLRQYFRVKPLSAERRELSRKYLSGLDYQMYNMLVVDWDRDNVTDILMPGLFDDLYRMYTGENLKFPDDKIPADIFEEVMMTYLPVSIQQLREHYQYDDTTDSYWHEQIFTSPYPPFGEIVEYHYNDDGTITLFADAVWADYNSDIAFTNEIVIQPLENGKWRYLSNHVEEKELELPPIARVRGR